MTVTRLAALCAVFAFALVGFPTTGHTIVAAPIQRLPPNARQLCSEHVSGTTMHISWTSFAVPGTVAETRAFYERLGLTFTTESDGSLTHAPNAAQRLMIFAAGASYPSCAQRPLPAERTVIVRSYGTQ